MKISLFLEMAADAEPERIALVCDGRRWPYAALLRAARGAAMLIRDSGCSHVALLDESSEAAPIALFGAALAGVHMCRSTIDWLTQTSPHCWRVSRRPA